MMSGDLRTAQPAEYLRRFLEEDVRPDGRELGEFRTTIINIGSITSADGSALVKQGNTTVICGIKAELAPPKAENPRCGYVVPNIELPPLCSPNFKSGPPTELAQVSSQLLENIITSSECINYEELCITEGKLVWVLYCDLICLDFDGNLIDVCVTALMSALKSVIFPLVSEDSESGQVKVDLDKKTSLKIHAEPVSTTFAIFEEKILFVDPTQEEETISSGTVTITTLPSGRVCNVFKPGGSGLNESQMQDCISSSISRGKTVNRLIDESILSVER